MSHVGQTLPPAVFIDRLHTSLQSLKPVARMGRLIEHVKQSMNCVTWSVSLFNLSHTLTSHEEFPAHRPHASHTYYTFIRDNLHQGMSLKVLANFLGYSEKYCSDLFARDHGEPFFDLPASIQSRARQHVASKYGRRWPRLRQAWDSAINSP